jgi:hypothetical protein
MWEEVPKLLQDPGADAMLNTQRLQNNVDGQKWVELVIKKVISCQNYFKGLYEQFV